VMYRNTDSWVLHADVYGTPEGFEVFVEVPGVLLEDIDLEVTPLTLSISGMKRTPCRGATALGIEIQTGSFEREIHLPARVDTSSVSADLKNGVLHVRLARKTPVRVTIPVQSEGNTNK